MTMLDMSQTIIAKSDQLNADDLIGKSITITITKVTGNDNVDQPVNVHFDGDNGKPFRPCKTIRRVMVAAWGKNAADYVGRSMTLYRDADVQFGGMKVGGIRVSHMSHIDGKLVVVANATKGKKRPIEVMPLRVQQPQQQSEDRAAVMADEYIDGLKAAFDREELEQLRTKGRKFVAKLKAQRPDLYARVIEADPHSAIPDRPANGEEAPADDAPNHSGEQAAPEQPAMELE